MNRDDIRSVLLTCLTDVAPELANEDVTDDADIRDELDLDSMDILRWVQGIHRKLGVEIPEEDYGQIASLQDAIDYIAGRV